MVLLRWLLLPFSLVYAVVIWCRNKAYDFGIFKSYTFNIPTVVIGNLAVGGAGKTPMTEFLINRLQSQFDIATLSRGYGRKTTGFIEVKENDRADRVGDEPLQLKRKFPNISVNVCEDRKTGIENLETQVELILLDDAFQHRKVKASCNILLFDYTSLLRIIMPLPTGNFRDLMNQTRRADLIVITKLPSQRSAERQTRILSKIRKHSTAPVFFSSIVYTPPVAVNTERPLHWQNDRLLAITGIANPTPFLRYISSQSATSPVPSLTFPDHHIFSDNDYRKIRNACPPHTKIITTEKDIQRLDLHKLEGIDVFALPIQFHIEEEEAFLKALLSQL